MLSLLTRLRSCLLVAAVVLTVGVLVPPAGTYARQYAFVQALQFVIFAVAAPALLGVGAGTRFQGLARPVARRAAAKAGETRTSRDDVRYLVMTLLIFIGMAIVWRVPSVTRGLAAHPVLTVLEMLTLLAAGLALWRELAGPSSGQGRGSRVLRAACAAVSMWTIWIIAYVTGMSSLKAGSGLAAVTDQQVGVAIMWAAPAICFVPAIFALIIPWLGEREDPDGELRDAAERGSLVTGLAGAPRPPRGWRLPPD